MMTMMMMMMIIIIIIIIIINCLAQYLRLKELYFCLSNDNLYVINSMELRGPDSQVIRFIPPPCSLDNGRTTVV